ncbi:hypothetical protein HDE_01494 [Halotydeus destructor]|nr:hypothetical protein HDE_01494 [Halotydeus destructor]
MKSATPPVKRVLLPEVHLPLQVPDQDGRRPPRALRCYGTVLLTIMALEFLLLLILSSAVSDADFQGSIIEVTLPNGRHYVISEDYYYDLVAAAIFIMGVFCFMSVVGVVTNNWQLVLVTGIFRAAISLGLVTTIECSASATYEMVMAVLCFHLALKMKQWQGEVIL